MTLGFRLRFSLAVGVVVLTGGSRLDLQAATDRFGTSSLPTRSSAQRTTRRSPSPRVVLPDPTLLDGSSHPAEKSPEYGMIGDFELPGDENQRTDRVGGQQGEQAGTGEPTQEAGSSGQPPPLENGGQSGQGGEKIAMAEEPEAQQAQGGGQEGDNQEGGGQEGQQNQAGPIGTAGPIDGQGDPNAKAEGMQVAQLKTDGEAGGAGAENRPSRPQQVSIGDSAMQIKSVANAPSVVGSQPAGQTQQMERKIGTGGIQAKGNNSNRGAERGQVMPAGL
jgi:hypothetical protein